jgi:hypothetical protein
VATVLAVLPMINSDAPRFAVSKNSKMTSHLLSDDQRQR